MTGVFAGALIISLPSKSTDAGYLGRDMALLAIPAAVAVSLPIASLRPKVADRQEE